MDEDDEEDDEDEDEDAREGKDEDDNKHSLAAMAATAVEAAWSESRALNRELLETFSTRHSRGEKKPMTDAVIDTDNASIIRAALDGSTIASRHLVGGQSGQKCVVRLALETGSTGFVVGHRGAADRLMPRDQATAAARILSLPNLFALETLDQSVPAWSSLPGAFAITEAGARATTDGTIANMDTKPKRIQSAVDYTMVVGNVAPGLEDALIMALTEAANQKIAAEFIAGAGVDPGAVGLRSLGGRQREHLRRGGHRRRSELLERRGYATGRHERRPARVGDLRELVSDNSQDASGTRKR